MDDTRERESVNELVNELRASEAKRKRKRAKPTRATPSFKEIDAVTQLPPDAPAPRLSAQVAQHGLEPTEMALCAWERRVKGMPIIDVAHELGLSIEAAKTLLRDVYSAVHDDLKDALEFNRQLDLERIDGLLRTFYPAACGGSVEGAQVTIRALQHRAKLVGLEPLPDPGRSQQPQNILVWIQNQLPQIQRIVEALPLDEPV